MNIASSELDYKRQLVALQREITDLKVFKELLLQKQSDKDSCIVYIRGFTVREKSIRSDQVIEWNSYRQILIVRRFDPE